MNQDKEKEVVQIFVASSMWEFEKERRQIIDYFDTLNQAHERDGVRLDWPRPETMSRALVCGGSQLPYNWKIMECRFFVLLIGRKLGKHTEAEFNLALKRFQDTGTPLIIPYFLNVRADMDVLRFQERLRKALDIDEQYIDTYDNLDMVLNHLHIELIRAGAFRREDAEPSDRETAVDKGLEGVRELIREQQARIAELDAQPVTPLIVREKTAAYEEIQRLSQKYDMAPDALQDYIVFLWKQHLYDTGISLGHWLERFYALHDPGEAVWAQLKNKIGICYRDSTHYRKAEQHFREALEIQQRLAKTNPSNFEPDLAESLNNLAILLYHMNRMKDAEQYQREALEIRQRLVKDNPAEFEPDLAESLNNLASLLYKTNRMEDAERHFWEALKIWKRLAQDNPTVFEPDLSNVYNNLACLLDCTPRKEDAERYWRKALEIRQHLAEDNPAAYEPYLANTCYNLGLCECYKGHQQIAKQYFKEALSLYEKFQHLEKDAQDCRYQISLL